MKSERADTEGFKEFKKRIANCSKCGDAGDDAPRALYYPHGHEKYGRAVFKPWNHTTKMNQYVCLCTPCYRSNRGAVGASAPGPVLTATPATDTLQTAPFDPGTKKPGEWGYEAISRLFLNCKAAGGPLTFGEFITAVQNYREWLTNI